jgi:hypothetical protein
MAVAAIPAILAGAMGGMGMANMFPPVSRVIQHGLNRLWPNEIIGLNEAIEAYYRGIIDRENVNYELKSTGLSVERQNWLLQLRQVVFNVVESIILWRRDEISQDELNSRLLQNAIPESEIPLWVKFTETRPGVQDIIRFAVREVYSPEIAEKFGQFEGYEAVAAIASPDLKAVGIRLDDFRKQWGAHWELPSMQMGFEMLHRGIINEDELNMLMRALDVMPFWRDKVTQISYNPLTRVDVRRMHKLGILTDADLLQSYKDIGYNEVNAQRMADFTKQYNANPESSEETLTDRDRGKQRDLTKDDILSGFADGLFSEQETGEIIYGLGYTQDEANFYISKVKYEQEKDTVNKLIAAYHTAYVGNIMSHNEISDKLGALNLAGQRVENLFNIWDIERSVRTQKPTKAEILTFLRKKIIDVPTAISELLGMGYAQRYVDMYLQTV